jgi:hypothetical protein
LAEPIEIAQNDGVLNVTGPTTRVTCVLCMGCRAPWSRTW